MDFTQHKPVRILTGEGCVDRYAALFQSLGKKALIVTGRSGADRSGAYRDVTAALEKAGCSYLRFEPIPENPPAPLCREGGATAREADCQFIVAIGGGSAMDAGKAIAGYATNPECDVMDLFDDEKRANGCLPIVAVPTTAGTGSEACRYSVLTIADGVKKKTFKCASSYPTFSFVDPRYSSTAGDETTVSTALDALAHGIESYLSPKSTATSEEAALFAAREIWDVLFRETDGKGPWTTVQRERLAYAATAAGVAIDATGTGFPHPLGYSLTLLKGIPHGKACAIFDGAFLSYNMIPLAGQKRVESLAAAIGAAPDEMIRRIPQMSGVSMKIPRPERERMIDLVQGAANFGNSPYVISRGEMSDIYSRLFS